MYIHKHWFTFIQFSPGTRQRARQHRAFLWRGKVTPAKNCCGARVGPQKANALDAQENSLVVFNPRSGSWNHQREKFTRSFFYFSDVFWIISQLILIFDRVSAVDKPSHLCTVLPHKKGCLISLIVCLIDLIALPLVSTKLFLEHKGRLTGLSYKPSIGGYPHLWKSPQKLWYWICLLQIPALSLRRLQPFLNFLGLPMFCAKVIQDCINKSITDSFPTCSPFQCWLLYHPLESHFLGHGIWKKLHSTVLHKLRTDSKIQKLRQLKHGKTWSPVQSLVQLWRV